MLDGFKALDGNRLLRDEFILKLNDDVKTVVTELHELTSNSLQSVHAYATLSAVDNLDLIANKIEAAIGLMQAGHKKLHDAKREVEANMLAEQMVSVTKALGKQRHAVQIQHTLVNLFHECIKNAKEEDTLFNKLMKQGKFVPQLAFTRHSMVEEELVAANETQCLENMAVSISQGNLEIKTSPKDFNSMHKIDFKLYDDVKLFSGEMLDRV